MGEQLDRRERKVCTGVFYLPPDEQRALSTELADVPAGDTGRIVVEALNRMLSTQAMQVSDGARLMESIGKQSLAIGDRFAGLDTRVAADVKANLQTRDEVRMLRREVAMLKKDLTANNALLAESARGWNAVVERLNKPKPLSALEQARTWFAQPGSKLVAAACVSLFVTLSIAVYAVVRLGVG